MRKVRILHGDVKERLGGQETRGQKKIRGGEDKRDKSLDKESSRESEENKRNGGASEDE